MRALIPVALLFCACGPPQQRSTAKTDPAAEPAYARTVAELSEIDKSAREAFTKGDPDLAARMIQTGEPLSKTLLSIPRPSLAATEAASELDRLYGDMLFSNRHYGWARLLYQKNLARWKSWTPRTDETVKRRRQAEDAIAECDRRIAAQPATR